MAAAAVCLDKLYNRSVKQKVEMERWWENGFLFQKLAFLRGGGKNSTYAGILPGIFLLMKMSTGLFGILNIVQILTMR